MTCRWAHFDHAADVGVEGRGDSPAEAFEQAAVAMTAVAADPALIRGDTVVDVHCQAPDPELLLVDWLNELIYAMSTRGLLFGRFSVHIDGDRLWGRAWGQPVDTLPEPPAVEVKGATLTGVAMRQIDGEWVARCVVDV